MAVDGQAGLGASDAHDDCGVLGGHPRGPHQRNKPVPPEVYDQYLPDQRSPLRYRSQSFWLERAERLGEDVVAYVREVFACDDVLSQLRTVQAVVTHLEKFPLARAQAACRRAQYYGNYTYPGVRGILRQGLDREFSLWWANCSTGVVWALDTPKHVAVDLFRFQRREL